MFANVSKLSATEDNERSVVMWQNATREKPDSSLLWIATQPRKGFHHEATPYRCIRWPVPSGCERNNSQGGLNNAWD
jgi:hypothetical protein